MQKFAILLGGDVTPTARLRNQLIGARAIAADSGIRHADPLGLVPELWVGDFDSTGLALKMRHEKVPRQVFPSAKDATDGEIAIAEALRLGAKDLVLVGAFGGQFDHVLAHAMAIMSLQHRGFSVFMTSGSEEAYPCRDQLRLQDLALGTRLSILPLTDLIGLSIANVRWPLTNADVKRGSSLTLSNESAGDPCVSMMSGEALVVVYPK